MRKEKETKDKNDDCDWEDEWHWWPAYEYWIQSDVDPRQEQWEQEQIEKELLHP